MLIAQCGGCFESSTESCNLDFGFVAWDSSRLGRWIKDNKDDGSGFRLLIRKKDNMAVATATKNPIERLIEEFDDSITGSDSLKSVFMTVKEHSKDSTVKLGLADCLQDVGMFEEAEFIRLACQAINQGYIEMPIPDSDVKMKFCWVPTGVVDGYFVAKYPTTQKEYEALIGSNPSSHKGENLPVERVSMTDSLAYAEKFSAGLDHFCGDISLPTESEWEYACRAGSTTEYYWGNECNGTQCNCDGRYPYGTEVAGPYLGKTSEVGSYEKDYPHPYGLCDMHGNVWEWCIGEEKNDKE